MNPQFDSYIERSAEFAQPILHYLRDIVHEACPLCEEKIKWGFPNFEYKKSILCSMAAFKQHCTFGFWLGNLMEDPDNILNPIGDTAMGQLGKIKSLKDLPPRVVLVAYIRNAMFLIDQGVKMKKKENRHESDTEVPTDLLEALKGDEKARATFEYFSPSNKKEYINWIIDAKTEKTRLSRLETTIEWLREGKVKNWKYQK
jgi:uncharacterized protein YdeI (YjbR/CyaY-like superfamily)